MKCTGVTHFGLACVVLAMAGSAMGREVTFAVKPSVTQEGTGTKIAFTAGATTDVEVAVVDGQGRVVRHLAAGMLGRNSPEPFQQDSLHQELTWDGKDDAGVQCSGGSVQEMSLKPETRPLKPFSIRVRLGSQPRLASILGHNDNLLSGSMCAITIAPNGDIYVRRVSDHACPAIVSAALAPTATRTAPGRAARSPSPRSPSPGPRSAITPRPTNDCTSPTASIAA